jgi:hypothetical protein
MNYDEKIKKAETIISELEQTQALSMETYKLKAAEAKELLDACTQELDAYSSEK